MGGDIERCWELASWGTEFDAIISLGGNCAVAHNTRIRDLRSCSFPFDWLLMDDPRPIDYLAHGFETSFSDLCLKENLVELVGAERGMEKPGRLQFYDKISGWKFIHHFNETADFGEEYRRVYSVLHRRISRMLDMFDSGGRFLLVLAPTFSVDKACLLKLKSVLAHKYPRSSFFFLVMSFCEQTAGVEALDDLIYCRVARAQNIYDFTKTNLEWSFLDRLRLTNPRKGTRIHKVRLWKQGNTRYILKWYIAKKVK